MANDPDGVRAAVKASHFFPVHKEITDIYSDTEIGETMDLFSKNFMLSMGDYYQVTPGWAEVRPLWWKALQDIANGKDIRETLIRCNNKANEIAHKASSKLVRQY